MGPCTELEYLGIVLDSVAMEARLPDDKKERLIEMLKRYSKIKSCTKLKLLSLLGHMSFASKVVMPGRSFMSYLLELTRGNVDNHQVININADCRADMSMWLTFINGWNGRSFFIDSDVSNEDIELYTDASSKLGFGGYYAGAWFQDKWPTELDFTKTDSLSMALLELYPIVMAAMLWGHNWSRKRIIFHCDNQATVQILRKGRSPCSRIMLLMRRLTYCAAINNFVVYSEFIPGICNEIGDALSRFQMDRFRRLAPAAQKNATPCIPYDRIIYP